MDVNKLEDILVFKGIGNSSLAVEVLDQLKEYLGYRPKVGHINYGRWGDGELEDRFADHENIRGKTLVFFECLKEESVMIRFLQLCWAAKYKYGAKCIIVVLSFMHYRRQDHDDYIHEVPRNEWLTMMMKWNGVDRVILATPHSEQIEKNFENAGVAFNELDLSDLFASRLRPFISEANREKIKVYSPDEGSIIRAINLAKRLELGVIFSLKNRGFNNETEIVEAELREIEMIKRQFDFFPNLEYATPARVNGATMIMVEDEIDSGGTAYTQGKQLRKYGAEKLYMIFTHAVCTDPWRRKLFGADNPFTQVIVSNTIPRGEEKRTGGKVHDVSIANPMASELFQALYEVLK